MSHQHKPTGMKQSNRKFKGKSKGRASRLNKGKVEAAAAAGGGGSAAIRAGLNPRAAAMAGAKQQRVNRAKQLQAEHRRRLAEARRSGPGSAHGPPKTVALVALTPHADLAGLRASMVEFCRASGGGPLEELVAAEPLLATNRHPSLSTCAANVDKRAMRFSFFECARDTDSVLDAAKVADQVLLVVAPSPAGGEAALDAADVGIDALGFHLLSVLVAQGLPDAVCLAQGLESLREKKRAPYRHVCQRVFESYAPGLVSRLVTLEAARPLESMRDTFRWVGQQRPEAFEWRANRAYLLAETATFLPDAADASRGTMAVSGFVRGQRALAAGQIVHVTGHGDFRVARVGRLANEQAFAPAGAAAMKRRAAGQAERAAQAAQAGAAAAAATASLDALVPAEGGAPAGPAAPDALEPLLPEDPFAANAYDQSVVTEEEIRMAEAHRQEVAERRQALDRQAAAKAGGASDIQAVWDAIASDDEGEEDDMSRPLGAPAGSAHHHDDDARSHFAPSEFGDMDMPHGVDEEEDVDQAAVLAERRRLARDEVDFPDEMETPLEVPARERFARYRGLKSLRSTPWHPYEALPVEYGRICQFENYDRTRRRVTAMPSAAASSSGEAEGEAAAAAAAAGARAGQHVFVFLEGVPAHKAQAMCDPTRPLMLWGLLDYERKVSVLHFVVRRHNDDVDEPVRGKDPMVFHCGFRRFGGRPVYSDSVVNADKHLVERFFMPNRHSVASVYGHIQFPPAPVLMFRAKAPASSPGPFNPLMAEGHLDSVNPNRILVKRVVLSGYPIHARKRHAVVRYMFFNAEDVRWFKPVQLHTKGGLIGHIREPRGTKGYMKCVFDGFIKQNDTVLMSLYKRQFPKWDPSVFGGDQGIYNARVVAPEQFGAAPSGAAAGDEDEEMA